METAKIYRFPLFLDGICAPKIIPILNVQNDAGLKSKEALSSLLLGRIVNIRDITTDKHGKLYVNVFVDDIHVNEWLLKNNYVMKCENGRKRRMSESDSHDHSSSKHFLPNIITIDSIIGSSSSLSPKKTEKTFLLPSILSEKIRPISASSSTIQTDCFLSHNWGDNHKNHHNVRIINDALKKRGLNTWFDENKIDGNIRYKMAEGIDNTKCVVVFITKEYREKVNSLDMKENCKYEFTYAMNQLGSQNMVPVVMETEMRLTNKWKGELGAALGSMLFIDLAKQDKMSKLELEKKYDELYKRIKNIIHRDNK